MVYPQAFFFIYAGNNNEKTNADLKTGQSHSANSVPPSLRLTSPYALKNRQFGTIWGICLTGKFSDTEFYSEYERARTFVDYIRKNPPA